MKSPEDVRSPLLAGSSIGVAGGLQYDKYGCAPGAFLSRWALAGLVPLVFCGGLCRPPAFSSILSWVRILIAAGEVVSKFQICLRFFRHAGLDPASIIVSY